MALTSKEIDHLMRLVRLTREEELNCEQCLALVAELAERAPAGRSIPEGLRLVEHHLEICHECREEFDALQRALSGLQSTSR